MAPCVFAVLCSVAQRFALSVAGVITQTSFMYFFSPEIKKIYLLYLVEILIKSNK